MLLDSAPSPVFACFPLLSERSVDKDLPHLPDRCIVFGRNGRYRRRTDRYIFLFLSAFNVSPPMAVHLIFVMDTGWFIFDGIFCGMHRI